MQTEDASLTPNPYWKVALVGIPLFLLLSGVGAMVLWWQQSKESAPDPRLALAAAAVGEAEMRDHLHKFEDLIGERNWETPAGVTGMRRALAFLEGTLSPQNYGFAVEKGAHRTRGEELWPVLWVDLPGSERAEEVVVVAVPYDLAAGPVAIVLGAINDLRDEKQGRTVRFAFYPAGLGDGTERGDWGEIVRKEEKLVERVVPDQPEGDGRETAADLVPRAQELVKKVRELGR